MKFLLCLLLAVFVADAVRYDRYHVFEVGPLKNEKELKIIMNLVDNDERLKQVILLNDAITKIAPIDLAINPDIVNRIEEILTENSIKYRIVETDLQRSFDETLELNEKAMSKYAKDEGISAFAHDAYLRYADQVSLMASYASASSIASTVNIGTSTQGRTLTALTINANNNQLPGIWLDAGIHAREWISQATLLYIADQILTGTSADAVYLRNNFRWYILPNVNPDGYEYSWTSDRMWRKTRAANSGSTCVGTDGNRNWDSNWGGPGASTNPCADDYRGSAVFSQPETRAQSNYMTTIASFTNLCISIHSYSEFWLVPWGGYSTKPSDYNELMRVGNAAATAIRGVSGKNFVVGTPPDILYVASGGTFDWAKEKAGMAYSYSPELRPATAGAGGFNIPASNIIPSGNEIFAAVVASARQANHKL